MNLGMTELLVIFGIILVLFGGRRLPGLGKALGDSIREFKDGISGKEESRVERQAEQLPPGSAAPADPVHASEVKDKNKV